jgi:hypothetical protein
MKYLRFILVLQIHALLRLDLLVPLLQRAHNDNGAKLRLDMLNVKAENGVLLPVL